MTGRTAAALTAAAVALHAWPALRLLSAPREPAAFVFQEPPPPSGEPVFHKDFVNPEAPDAHVASMCELSASARGVRLAAAWYSGSSEGAPDVCVYFATRDALPSGPGAERPRWSEPRVLVSLESARRELGRYIRRVGNAVIFTDRKGRLWLVYASVTVGGWWGSSLNVKTSADGGETWTRSRRLTLSPFLGISELVRSKPVMLGQGGFVLPIYHECIALFPELLWVTPGPGGRMSWRKSRIAGGRSFIQPAVVPLGPASASALFRCWAPERAVPVSASSNGGLTWTRPVFTELPNPNSAVDATLLSGGRMLLAFNDHETERDNLRLAVSADGGRSWARAATLEEDTEKRFSYPFVIRTSDGMIHVVYTWHGNRIKHVEFNEAWLEEQPAGKRPAADRKASRR